MDRRGKTRAELVPLYAHLVGLADRDVSGLAQILTEGGASVSVSDGGAGAAVKRLRRLGTRIHPAHCPRGTQILAYGPEIGRDHPARLAATRRGIAQGSVANWLSAMMSRSIGLVVAGRREASIASAMIGWTLARAGLDPTVVLGRSVPQLGGWARLGSGLHFVTEAIDGPGEVGPLAPRVAVLLDVAPGAAPPIAAARASALRRFVLSVPAGGSVVALERNEVVAAAVDGLATEVEWLSLERRSTWWGADLREERGCYRFRAFHRGRFVLEVRLRVPGLRNVLGALAAVAACDRLDVPAFEIKEGLEEFAGLSGDFEPRGSYRGVTLVDDAGRDAASVSEALGIARQVFGTRPLWAVYRAGEGATAEDEAGYHAAFAAADYVLVARGGQAGSDGPAADSLVSGLVASGVRARGVASLDDAIGELDRNLEPGDVLVTLGSGEVGTIADAFIRRLSRDRQGR